MSQPAAPEDDLLPSSGLTDDLRHKVEEFIEEEEGSFNRYKGWLAAFLTAVAFVTLEVSWVIFLIFVAIAALAAGLQGWLLRKTNLLERSLLVLSGALVFALKFLRRPRAAATS